MKILITGANGYIGQRLILSLLSQGHKVVCLVREAYRFDKKKFFNYDGSFYLPDGVELKSHEAKPEDLEVITGDLLDPNSLGNIPEDIDIAYYLVHSMSTKNRNDFDVMEIECARNFSQAIKKTKVQQIIYLSGISNDDNLSRHLSSRKHVEEVLKESKIPLTVLRAAIIIGSGSASFEIIRDLVEKLPFMVAPKWLNVRCQPIAVRNVIQYMTGVIGKQECYDKVFDIGGPEILTYKEMLFGYARVRGLKRWIITLPVLTPRLSAYWLHFITSTNYALARTLVSSLKNEVICKLGNIQEIIPLKLINYEDAINKALYRISRDEIPSSWRDALNIKTAFCNIFARNAHVPRYGCFFDIRTVEFDRDINEVRDNVWMIGGKRGWYYFNWAWKLRGNFDKLIGGVGLRRGRRADKDLQVGDAVDFWRVLQADYENRYLVLFAEMKLPGEAWLEFRLEKLDNGKNKLTQKATFRPRGILGRLYWYALTPIHFFIFQGMANEIVNYKRRDFYTALPAQKPEAHAH